MQRDDALVLTPEDNAPARHEPPLLFAHWRQTPE